MKASFWIRRILNNLLYYFQYIITFDLILVTADFHEQTGYNFVPGFESYKFGSKTCDLSWIFVKLSNNWSPFSNSLSTAFILSGFTRDCSKLSPNRLTSLCSILRNVFSSNVSRILWLSEIGPNIQ